MVVVWPRADPGRSPSSTTSSSSSSTPYSVVNRPVSANATRLGRTAAGGGASDGRPGASSPPSSVSGGGGGGGGGGSGQQRQIPVVDVEDGDDGRSFQCPFCGVRTPTLPELEGHILRLHEQPTSAAEAQNGLRCPVCNDVGFASVDVLNAHVNRHFGDTPSSSSSSSVTGTAAAGTGFGGAAPAGSSSVVEGFGERRVGNKRSNESEAGKRRKVGAEGRDRLVLGPSQLQQQQPPQPSSSAASVPVVSSSSDSRLRRALDSLYSQRKEFLLKQMQRGFMSYGDYHLQLVQGSRADESGLDDGSSRSRGMSDVVAALGRRVDAGAQTVVADKTDHFSVTFFDKGWSCGYRNIQMMWSSLNHDPTFRPVLVAAFLSVAPGRGGGAGPVPEDGVPSVTHLQQLIEAAWTSGFDVDGGRQLGSRLVGGTTWIGATEVYALFSSMGVKCRLIDFWRPTGPGGTHPELFAFLERHFAPAAAAAAAGGGARCPVYLQEQGHSMTVAGLHRARDGRRFAVVFDPGVRANETMQACRRVMRAAAVEQAEARAGGAENVVPATPAGAAAAAAVNRNGGRGGGGGKSPAEDPKAVFSLILRSLERFKAPQYQVLVPVGIVASIREQQSLMTIRSERIP